MTKTYKKPVVSIDTGMAEGVYAANGTITLNITFNDTVDQAETDDASVQTSWSGKTATFIFASTATNPLTIGIHLNHGTSIDDLKMTGFTYSVN